MIELLAKISASGIGKANFESGKMIEQMFDSQYSLVISL